MERLRWDLLLECLRFGINDSALSLKFFIWSQVDNVSSVQKKMYGLALSIILTLRLPQVLDKLDQILRYIIWLWTLFLVKMWIDVEVPFIWFWYFDYFVCQCMHHCHFGWSGWPNRGIQVWTWWFGLRCFAVELFPYWIIYLHTSSYS